VIRTGFLLEVGFKSIAKEKHRSQIALIIGSIPVFLFLVDDGQAVLYGKPPIQLLLDQLIDGGIVIPVSGAKGFV
jgi:hypothetical protein